MKNIFKIMMSFTAVMICLVAFSSCNKEEGSEHKISNVIPDSILNNMRGYIVIHDGDTPPDITGTFFIDPMATIYCEDYKDGKGGGFAPGKIVNSKYIKFSNQDNTNLTVEYKSESKSGSESEEAIGAFISGSGNDFSVFFNTEGTSSNISTKTALVISGTKTSSGIKNLRYAFVMIKKGSDPENKLMAEGVFRIYKDEDELAETATHTFSGTRAVESESLSEELGTTSCAWQE